MLRFFSAIGLLLLAVFLQLFFASVGWHFTLTLAVLIACAFAFDLWELLVLDLLAVFILNWQPAPSVTLIIFALIPLAAFAFRRLVHSEAWIGNLVAIAAGFLVFYLISAPTQFLPNIFVFLEDLIVGLVAGGLTLMGLT